MRESSLKRRRSSSGSDDASRMKSKASGGGAAGCTTPLNVLSSDVELIFAAVSVVIVQSGGGVRGGCSDGRAAPPAEPERCLRKRLSELDARETANRSKAYLFENQWGETCAKPAHAAAVARERGAPARWELATLAS